MNKNECLILDVENKYMDELIDFICDNGRVIQKYAGPIIKRFSCAHMTVKPDKNRVTLTNLTVLMNSFIEGKNSMSEITFDMFEALITSIVHNGDFEGRILLSEIPEFPLNVVMTLMTPVDYILNKTENCTWFREYGESLFELIIDTYVATVYPENLLTTMMRCFPIQLCIQHIYDVKFLTERWYDALKHDQIGAGVSLQHCIKIFNHVSDLYSDRRTRIKFFNDVIPKKYHQKRVNDMIRDTQDRWESFFGDKTRLMISTVCQAMQDFVIYNQSSELCQIITDLDCLFRQNNISSIGAFIGECIQIVDLVESYGKESTHAQAIHDKLEEAIQHLDATKTNSTPDHSGWLLMNIPKNTEKTPTDFQMFRGIPMFDGIDGSIIQNNAPVTEAVHKDSAKMNAAGKKMYKAYRTYKEAEEKVDSQLTKAVSAASKLAIGDVKSEVIEGKKYTVLGILKKALGTVALFSTGKIRALILLVVRFALRKKATESEKRKVIMELETEIEMITEKIEDARGDNNREAKYAMMRTKKDLENALKRVQFGMEADTKSIQGAKSALNDSRANR